MTGSLVSGAVLGHSSVERELAVFDRFNVVAGATEYARDQLAIHLC